MEIAKIIDHTNINKKAKAKDIKKTCQEAKIYGFRGVCVRPEWVKLVKKELEGTDIHPVKSCEAGISPKAKLFNRVKVVVLIDPPMGQSSHQKRMAMCRRAKKDGADNLDVVMNIVDLKYEKYDKVLEDLKEICQVLPTKVIIGSGYLTDEEIIKASQIVKKAGAICVKTATEKDPLEHRELKEKFFHLKLMREGAPGLLIKAAGGIRTFSDAKEAIKAGADIIGTSSGVEIMKEIKK
jgi:deoxyribose-phosphate aldolase